MPRPPSHIVTFTARRSGSHLVQVTGAFGAVMRHAHRSVCITSLQRGMRRFSFEPEECVLMPGQVLVIAPGVVHRCGPYMAFSGQECEEVASVARLSGGARLSAKGQQATHASLCVPPDWFPVAQSCMITAPELATLLCHLPESSELYFLEQLCAIMEAGGPVVRLIAGQEAGASRDGAPEDVRTALRAVESMILDSDDTGGAFSLELLAEECQSDAARLSRRFRYHVGMPPVAWHMLRRIQQGAALLRQGHAITEAAYGAGFYDQSHFSHRFRQIMGMTPGQYLAGFSRADEHTPEPCPDEE